MKKIVVFFILFLCFAAVSFSQTGIVRTGVVCGLGFDTLIGIVNTGKLKIAETPCSPVTCSFTTLPLRLLDFSGTKLLLVNQLMWKTAGEENVAYYEIERSETGHQFDSIGKIVSLNITSSYQYDFTDPAYLQGKNYYRLKMVDIDGKYTFSKIILLQRDVFGKILLYPNPASRSIYVEVYCMLNANYELAITDVTGRKLFVENRNGIAGVNTWQLDVNNLNNGTYFLRIMNKKEQVVQNIFFEVIHY